MMTEPELLAKLDGIECQLSGGQAYWLYQQACNLPDDANILEIGCLYGCSSSALALGCEGTKKRVFVVEIDRNRLSVAAANWRRIGVFTAIRAHGIDSANILNIAQTWFWPKFQFAFIDGDHMNPAPRRDLQNVIRLMDLKGRIAMHDVIDSWPDVKETWRKWALPRLRNIEYFGSIGCGMV
jgi:predicted O-methyltransferase YrrM